MPYSEDMLEIKVDSIIEKCKEALCKEIQNPCQEKIANYLFGKDFKAKLLDILENTL